MKKTYRCKIWEVENGKEILIADMKSENIAPEVLAKLKKPDDKMAHQPKKAKSKVDWKIYTNDDLIQMCKNLGINIDHLTQSSMSDSIRRMRLVMAIKKFGMVGDEIAPAAFN